ncbi:MAG: hypothetical protein DBY10_05470 [Clostridiales bacterium]|nr:hypothetical protein [Oscillospiraceae bacterium]PWL90899.1 MAG: hypothetical protein DBY10_05470 [Clostridiales bacterium]
MKKINSAIDRFCYQHPRFGIPNLMLWVVIGNVIVYVMDMMSRGTFSAMLSFVPAYIFQGQIWRLVTFVLVPNYGSNIFFFAISAYFYYFIGSRLENQWGTARFNFFYCSGIVLAIVVGLLEGLIGGGMAVTSTMEYNNLSLFFAFASLFPDMMVLLFFIIPVKVKWLAYLDAAWLLYGVVSLLLKGAYISALLPVLAILNYLIFFGDSLIEALRGRGQRVQHRYSRQTIHFKKAAKEAQQKTGYLHKCCVCGRTDADYPDLEFRYCSKCAGYRCYCMDHINNHVHVTEE